MLFCPAPGSRLKLKKYGISQPLPLCPNPSHFAAMHHFISTGLNDVVIRYFFRYNKSDKNVTSLFIATEVTEDSEKGLSF